jgi:hypothetical protein
VKYAFDPQEGLIIVVTEVAGSLGVAVVRLALDTGAKRTMLNAGILTALGYDPALSRDRIELTTGSGVEYTPLVAVDGLTCLGEERRGFPVICHTLPPSAGIDGVLGLDFFHKRKLMIDMSEGIVELYPATCA